MDVERRADVELIENCHFMFYMYCQYRAIEGLNRFHLRSIKQNFIGLQNCLNFKSLRKVRYDIKK